MPVFVGQFDTFQDWVDQAEHVLVKVPESTYAHAPYICVDAKGRRCWSGKQFMRARDEGDFPVRYFWQCAPGGGV